MITTDLKRPAGCPWCRQDLIRFVRETKLPRFTAAAGEEFHVSQSWFTDDGGVAMGGGVAGRESFVHVRADASRGIHQGERCTGDRLASAATITRAELRYLEMTRTPDEEARCMPTNLALWPSTFGAERGDAVHRQALARCAAEWNARLVAAWDARARAARDGAR